MKSKRIVPWVLALQVLVTGNLLFAQLNVALEHLGKGMVKVEFSNGGANSISFLRCHTPLDEVEANMFRVERNGELVPYDGKVTFRDAPSDGDWVTLPPGAKNSVTVDLSEHYVLDQAGAYSVQFSFPICMRSDTRDIAAYYSDTFAYDEAELQSTIADFYLEEPFQHPAMSRDTSDRGFSGCSQTQKQEIQKAFAIGKEQSAKAYCEMTKKSCNSTKYETWFGAYSQANYQKVKNNFKKISATFGKEWNYTCTSCKPGVVAYVYPSKPYNVWVCKFFHDKKFSPSNRGSVLLHESTHWKVSAGTTDHGYGASFCKNLAKSSPAKAVQNADSYRYYCIGECY